MLQRLFIQNYAIISSIEISFSRGLNIITGETGAGKSILVGALGLILGERADSAVLMDATKKCIAEGAFNVKEYPAVKNYLQESDLDAEDELTIRREVAANGKSRAFINDTPVTLQQLKRLTSLLVSMHQQFDTLQLGDDDFQREVLDALAGNTQLLHHYKTVFGEYTRLQHQLEDYRKQQAAFSREKDYHTFLFSELEEAAFRENELEEAEATLKLLSNAEQVKASLDRVNDGLNGGEHPVVHQLKSLANLLQSLGEFYPEANALSDRMQSAQIELKDIAEDVERLSDTVVPDTEKMEELNDRLALGYRLQKKHGVQNTADLLAIQSELGEKLTRSTDLDTTITRLEAELDKQLKQAKKLAAELSDNRKKQLPAFEKKTMGLLTQVGMPNAKIKVQITDAALNNTGGDNIAFLFDGNNSGRFEPLRKVASGGELSRLMLCIKSLVAASVKLPTLIFDEIDSGISGEAAKQVGIIMKELGRSHQVISITHQPQIAARADMHLFVYKQSSANTVNTFIKTLSENERVAAVAQMLGGEKPSASALENAREMIGRG